MRRLVALSVLLLGCSGSKVEPGGCTIIEVATTGEYPTAQLTKLKGGPDQVCGHIVEAWNADPYLTGTAARYRCSCP